MGLVTTLWFLAQMELPGHPCRRVDREVISAPFLSTVIVWKLDRAFRNALDCLRCVEEWQRLGVSLRIIDLGGQPIDTKSAAGKFMLTIVAAVAEMERSNARERQRAGIEAARKRNGSKCPWGGRPMGATTIDYPMFNKSRRKSLWHKGRVWD